MLPDYLGLPAASRQAVDDRPAGSKPDFLEHTRSTPFELDKYIILESMDRTD
jgi:hypothetical protein